MKNTLLALTMASALIGCSSFNTQGNDSLELYEQANQAGKDQTALKYLMQAANEGNPKALSRLGESYLNGRYNLDDPEKGVVLLQQSANQGESRAMTNLGIAYLYGQGIEQDYQQAYYWLTKAQESGDMKAPRYIGLIYQNGWGKEQDVQNAANYFQIAADLGDITSQYYLGKLYETGQGVPQDYAKAISLYKQSAARGDHVSLPAIQALANTFEKGLGVKPDIEQAIYWYKKAASLGDTEASLKIGQYQYPAIPELMNIAALVKILGDGQKVAGIALQYTSDIDASSLNPSDFQVENREISRVYLSGTPELGKEVDQGSIVIVELKTEIDPNSAQMAQGPQKQAQTSDNADNGPGAGGPQLGQISDKSAEPTILHASITQSGAIRLVSGKNVEANDTKLDSNETLTPAIEGFKQLVFHDEKLNKELMYNLYVPKNYDPKKSYPLVLFIHDAGVVSNNPIETLTQGLGAVVWASDRDQSIHESFVLAPQYNAIMADDNSKTSIDMDVTVNLLNELTEEYSIDRSRLYNTGQSMGGMTSIAMDIKYPDLFAASLLVACQWDPALVAPLANKPLWIVVSEGDTKANPGMDAITEVLKKKGVTITEAMWNAEASDSILATQVHQMLSQKAQVNYTVFEGGSHRYTWQYAYSIDGIRDWLFRQHK